jgi:hypothetical protein
VLGGPPDYQASALTLDTVQRLPLLSRRVELRQAHAGRKQLPFLDPEEAGDRWTRDEERFLEASVHVERWEKGSEEEGLWFFVALQLGCPSPTR